MILYFASYKHAEEIEKAVDNSNKPVMEKKVVSQYDLSLFLKQQIDQLRPVEYLVIDLASISNTDNEILSSISNFRMLYGKTKVIIIATERDAKDGFLSEIFCMGIYDIIAGEMDKDQLVDELIYCIEHGKSYRESLIYKEENVIETNTQIRERVIIKNEIRTAVNKAFIGFMGTQCRIGTSHNAIVCGNYLKNKGFKIAIVEDKLNTSTCFETIKESFDIKGSSECFSLNQIDYYPVYDITEIYKIMTKNYNFILIDFGVFSSEKIAEFNRCVIPIIISGAKPWEIDHINRIFDTVKHEDLCEYTYLFNYIDDTEKSNIKKGMVDLGKGKVFFSEYTPDPFNSLGYDELDELFKGYIPETITHTRKNKLKVKELQKWISGILK